MTAAHFKHMQEPRASRSGSPGQRDAERELVELGKSDTNIFPYRIARPGFNAPPLFALFPGLDRAGHSLYPRRPPSFSEAVALQDLSGSDNRAGESRCRLPAW